MRALAGLLVLVSLAAAQEAASVAQRFLEQERAAFLHYRREEWVEAVAAFERQIATFADNPRPYYNIACCYGLQGDAARAATWLDLAISHGWRDANHLGEDPDFAKVRASEEFRRVMRRLESVRRADPDPMPRPISFATVPRIPSVDGFLRLSVTQAEAIWNNRILIERHQLLSRLFRIYDRRMAALGRYVMENGDAPDAERAALARVETASLYGEHAEGDGPADLALREASGRYVRGTADQFLRGFPGSPHLPRVRLLRARALTDPAARRVAFESIIEDHADRVEAHQARISLCAVLADAGLLDDLVRAFDALPPRLQDSFHPELVKARLLVRGMPDLSDLAPSGRVVPISFRGTVVYLFVSADSVDCERMLARVRELVPRPNAEHYPVVLCLDPPERMPDADLDRWFAKHAAGLTVVRRAQAVVNRIWIAELPMIVLARAGGEVLAVDPDAETLARLVGKRSR